MHAGRGSPSRFAIVVLIAMGGLPAASRAQDAPAPLSFERDIRPILRAHCFDCHGAEDAFEGNLDLRQVRSMERGGDSGPAIARGDAGASLIVARIRSGEMPPSTHKVKPEELDLLERWVAAGAPTARPEPETIPPGLGITPEEREWWSFRPLVRPPLPAVAHPELVAQPIDAFLLARLEAVGLSFSPPADRATLIRRASIDLLGLPPSAEEVEAFVADPDPAAFEHLVDRLLASPRYGERWARHWLDVAGYADSAGATQDDPPRPYAWKYRDWVVRALNADVPFDRFLVEQLAGDELVPPPHAQLPPESIDRLTATGFLRMAADGTAGGGDPESRNRVVADTLGIVSSALLGLTVGCAQCHDHRYDPIPQSDYYALRALFEPALDPQAWKAPNERLLSLFTDADRTRSAEIEAEAVAASQELETKQTTAIAAALEKELLKHPEDLREKLGMAARTAEKDRTPEQQQLLKERPSVNISPGVLYQYDQAAADELKALGEKIAAIRARKPVEDFLHVLEEPPGHLPVTRVFHRGDYRQPKGEVGPADLQVTGSEGETVIPADDSTLSTSGRRLAWARRLTSGRHPLLGRVIVNRLWMHHFGRGIVGTPADFGRLGERPSHPELLDWLAVEFADSGWSLKRFHRMVLLSSAWRQASTRRGDLDSLDADNRLVGRMPVRRLEAEAVRDRILAAAGTLDPTPFGNAVPVVADEAGEFVVKDSSPRRSLWIEQRRSMPVQFLATFDAPTMQTNCDRRIHATAAGQALLLMNGDFALAQARRMADAALAAAGTQIPDDAPVDAEAQALAPAVTVAWRRAYGRSPEADEAADANGFLADELTILRGAAAEIAAPAERRARALANLCQQLLSSNEFLHVD
jgi:mono/diheme cytochrome c family protein